jgi:hypothetical protein
MVQLLELQVEKEICICGAYSTVNMNNSKVWLTRMGHMGNNHLQQLAKIVDGMNVKVNSEVAETCVSGKQT